MSQPEVACPAGQVESHYRHHVRRKLLRSVSPVCVRAGKTTHPQLPSSFPKRSSHGGVPFRFWMTFGLGFVPFSGKEQGVHPLVLFWFQLAELVFDTEFLKRFSEMHIHMYRLTIIFSQPSDAGKKHHVLHNMLCCLIHTKTRNRMKK